MGANDNLPPGVTDSMIPGNRPEDVQWEAFHERVDEDCTKHGLMPEEAMMAWQLGIGAWNTGKGWIGPVVTAWRNP